MTKGTYAVYQGQAEVLSISIDFNARMEVVDLNSTHVEISTSFDMDSSFGSSENTTSMWVSREEMNFQPEGLNLSSSYTTQITTNTAIKIFQPHTTLTALFNGH